MGVAGLTDQLQDGLFDLDATAAHAADAVELTVPPEPSGPRRRPGWSPGADVRHDAHGAGWVWGSGLGRVTVRFETRDTPPGPVLTFAEDDPALHLR